MTDQNPLLEIRHPIRFREVLPEHIGPAVAELIAQAQARIDAICDCASPDWDNTMAALDVATEPLDVAFGVARHLESTVTTPELREAVNDAQPLVAEFYAGIPLNERLWSALQRYAATPEAAALTGLRRRYLDKTLDSFRRAGAELPPEKKERLKAINVELATATNKFSQNVLDATAIFEWVTENEKDLAGLPASARAMARRSAEQKGFAQGWRFTLAQPSYQAVMTYLDDAAVRERFWRAYNRRAADAPYDNEPLMARILELRREKAQLLGFAHFADLVLVERMAKTGAAARSFVDDLTVKTRAAFDRENEELRAFRGPGPELAPWDIAYWAEKKRAVEYAFEEEDLRPYFPLDAVVAGMFSLVEKIFGIRVDLRPEVEGWHDDVRFYEIREEGGDLIGGFYTDWYPRDDKRQGAWMDAFLTGRTAGGRWQPHIGLMCGNLTPPLKDRPALLTHRDVETIFHEFGHLLHHCLSKVEIRSLAGTSVAWDFVELPSQIMENWCWERPCLDLFARHWETGATIPEDLFQKMVRARTYRSANAQMRQLSFGVTDLALHIDYDPARDDNPIAYARRKLAEFAPSPLPEGHAMFASFTHLFADPVGYGAGYYSYKWAEVLDADAFSRFRREGIFSRDTGMAFRRAILERGDSADPAELFRDFMGRDPDPSALLERLGLN